jgi:hypothetical protein
MDIIQFVTDHQKSYQHWFMHQTFGALRNELLKIPTFEKGDVDRKDARFSKSSIVVKFGDQPMTHWATNVLKQDPRDASVFTAYIYLDRSILHAEPELRKAVLAEEWLEVMVGIEEPDRRRSKRTTSRTSLVELYSTLGRGAHWMDDDEEQAEKRVGLQHLMLPDELILTFIADRYKTSVREIRELSEDESTANEAGRVIRSIERSISAEKFLKLELVQLRLTQFIFSGRNGKRV